jgi:hypothetical protein
VPVGHQEEEGVPSFSTIHTYADLTSGVQGLFEPYPRLEENLIKQSIIESLNNLLTYLINKI